jgi:hypothetical protein
LTCITGIAGDRLQQFVEVRLVLRRQVQDDDERHAAFRRHALEELQQAFQPAGRRTDSDDGEVDVGSRGSGLGSIHEASVAEWWKTQCAPNPPTLQMQCRSGG